MLFGRLREELTLSEVLGLPGLPLFKLTVEVDVKGVLRLTRAGEVKLATLWGEQLGA